MQLAEARRKKGVVVAWAAVRPVDYFSLLLRGSGVPGRALETLARCAAARDTPTRVGAWRLLQELCGLHPTHAELFGTFRIGSTSSSSSSGGADDSEKEGEEGTSILAAVLAAAHRHLTTPITAASGTATVGAAAEGPAALRLLTTLASRSTTVANRIATALPPARLFHAIATRADRHPVDATATLVLRLAMALAFKRRPSSAATATATTDNDATVAGEGEGAALRGAMGALCQAALLKTQQAAVGLHAAARLGDHQVTRPLLPPVTAAVNVSHSARPPTPYSARPFYLLLLLLLSQEAEPFLAQVCTQAHAALRLAEPLVAVRVDGAAPALAAAVHDVFVGRPAGLWGRLPPSQRSAFAATAHALLLLLPAPDPDRCLRPFTTEGCGGPRRTLADRLRRREDRFLACAVRHAHSHTYRPPA